MYTTQDQQLGCKFSVYRKGGSVPWWLRTKTQEEGDVDLIPGSTTAESLGKGSKGL